MPAGRSWRAGGRLRSAAHPRAEAGLAAARAGAIVGFAGTSNVAGSRAYGIPAVGTMAHSFVEAFDEERDAFRAFARHTAGPVTLLVDTYDTPTGVHVAADVLRELLDHRGFGVRLDSGDLGALARDARRILDEAGLPHARIVVSGGLDEYAVEALVASEAPVDVFAVGTKVGTSADHPYLDTAYKLVEYADRPVMKLSAGKSTAPAPKQVFRGPGCRDLLAVRDEVAPPGCAPLLEHVMTKGRRTALTPSPAEAVAAARHRFTTDMAALPNSARQITQPTAPEPETSPILARLTEDVRHDLIRSRSGRTRVPGG